MYCLTCMAVRAVVRPCRRPSQPRKAGTERGVARGRGGCALFVNGHNRMTIDPRIPAMPGRNTSGSHQPGRHCLHQARSAVRCSARCMKEGGALSTGGSVRRGKNRNESQDVPKYRSAVDLHPLVLCFSFSSKPSVLEIHSAFLNDLNFVWDKFCSYEKVKPGIRALAGVESPLSFAGVFGRTSRFIRLLIASLMRALFLTYGALVIALGGNLELLLDAWFAPGPR